MGYDPVVANRRGYLRGGQAWAKLANLAQRWGDRTSYLIHLKL